MCRIGARGNHEFALYSLQNIKENIQEVGFLLKIDKPVSEFWTETGISLKIIEPNQPLITIPLEQLIKFHE